ncbi:efflux RND transporter periplasmic adaptor subunit [Actinomadura sp. HBU206391]|uniref:efflux RND transporter periplasmic adaptor subunit n=1 Tax=Actinomadura sp. HBU206391 TaxID=2731692 RepID=UPI0016501B14|nr:HlyD family efflux transporter periplasmic adaptor subunit [Actinomadura sp. HBU206391]MBC6458492.1 HlyD family efflux transporter periplasmic adaptor subunit [Actinomadura sp. HBU206391]
MKFQYKRRNVLVNGTLGVLLAAGVGIAYVTLAGDGDSADAATRSTQVTRGTVEQSVSAAGAVESAETRSLSFGASGTVSRVSVKPGQKVAKGKELARLDRTEALENLAAAKANLVVAEDADTSTAQGYSAYVSAKNAYNSAVRQVDGTVLKAPFSGTVTAVNGTVGGSSGGSGSSTSGSTASGGSGTSAGSSSSSSGSSSGSSSSGSTGTGFIELANTSKLQIEGSFTEADTTKLKAGQAATVSFDALTGVTAEGKVTAIDPAPTTTDNVVRYGATITLTGTLPKVRLGQTASIQIVVAHAENVLYVPSAAVRTAGGQSTVTVRENGRPVVKTVEIGVAGAQGTEIRSGLAEGEQVVIPITTGSTGGGFPAGGGVLRGGGQGRLLGGGGGGAGGGGGRP